MVGSRSFPSLPITIQGTASWKTPSGLSLWHFSTWHQWATLGNQRSRSKLQSRAPPFEESRSWPDERRSLRVYVSHLVSSRQIHSTNSSRPADTPPLCHLSSSLSQSTNSLSRLTLGIFTLGYLLEANPPKISRRRHSRWSPHRDQAASRRHSHRGS